MVVRCFESKRSALMCAAQLNGFEHGTINRKPASMSRYSVTKPDFDALPVPSPTDDPAMSQEAGVRLTNRRPDETGGYSLAGASH